MSVLLVKQAALAKKKGNLPPTKILTLVYGAEGSKRVGQHQLDLGLTLPAKVWCPSIRALIAMKIPLHVRLSQFNIS